jgi:hypothetical protein
MLGDKVRDTQFRDTSNKDAVLQLQVLHHTHGETTDPVPLQDRRAWRRRRRRMKRMGVRSMKTRFFDSSIKLIYFQPSFEFLNNTICPLQ